MAPIFKKPRLAPRIPNILEFVVCKREDLLRDQIDRLGGKMEQVETALRYAKVLNSLMDVMLDNVMNNETKLRTVEQMLARILKEEMA